MSSEILPPVPPEPRVNVFNAIASQNVSPTTALGLLYKGAEGWLRECMTEPNTNEQQASALVCRFIDENLEAAHISRERLKILLCVAAIAANLAMPTPEKAATIIKPGE